MDPTATVHLTTASAWRSWLRKNHAKQDVVWLVFSKGRTGKPVITYEEAVCEALCFGWVDSIIQRIDDKKYARKFTPRTDTTKWSASNLRRLEALVRDGKMSAAGLAKISLSAQERQAILTAEEVRIEPELSPDLKRALAGDRKAMDFFEGLPPSHRRRYVAWIMSAKRTETREKRLQEAMEMLSRGEKLGMK